MIIQKEQKSATSSAAAFCVVAVGSTQFEELIEALDCEEFYNMLKELQICGLLFQIGTGKYIPHMFSQHHHSMLTVEVHNFIILEDYIKNAAMVISHCGAGILLESLRAVGTPNIIAVVNSSLMGNHQSELADQLASDGLIYKAEPGNVLNVIRDRVIERITTQDNGGPLLKKYPPKTQGLLIDIIDQMLLSID